MYALLVLIILVAIGMYFYRANTRKTELRWAAEREEAAKHKAKVRIEDTARVESGEWLLSELPTNEYIEVTSKPKDIQRFQESLFDFEFVPLNGLADRVGSDEYRGDRIGKSLIGKPVRLFHDIYSSKSRHRIVVTCSDRRLSKFMEIEDIGYFPNGIAENVLQLKKHGFAILAILQIYRSDEKGGEGILTIGICGEESRRADIPVGVALDKSISKNLFAAGYTTVGSVNSAPDASLLAVPGVGKQSLLKIRSGLSLFMNSKGNATRGI